jgi:hypothetical protein
MGGVPRSPRSAPHFPAHRLKIPPQVPLAPRRGLDGGSAVGRTAHGLPHQSRSAQRRTGRASLAGAAGAVQPTRHPRAVATPRPACHQGSRRRTTGAAGEPLRALVELCPCLQRPGTGRGGCPGWRSGRRSGRQAGLVHAQREGKGACDPRARARADVVIGAGNAGLIVCGVRDGSPYGARRWPDRPMARRAAQQPGPARRGHAQHSCSCRSYNIKQDGGSWCPSTQCPAAPGFGRRQFLGAHLVRR